MSNDNENEDFFRDYDKPQDKLSVDVPVSPQPTHIEKIPSAYDPMGEIYARGRAMRGMSSGVLAANTAEILNTDTKLYIRS